MSDSQLDNLVRRAVELTGAEPPEVLESGSAALAPASPAARQDGFYLVGLIGGKEVGKSALVNALVGKAITRPIGHGEGTAGVVAYAHRDQVEALGELLDDEVPGRFSIVPHDNSSLRRQVLVDLPDIDSHWADHLEITRRMLRHMLYPLWIQSIEKYADRQPQELLKKVAAGNSAENFLFCLNKVDQLGESAFSSPLPPGEGSVAHGNAGEGARGVSTAGRSESTLLAPSPGFRGSNLESLPSPGGRGERGGAAEELREDFARRLAETLGLASQPKVWLISAANPHAFELPKLAALLSQQRSEDDVARSLKIALRQRERSVLGWLDGQGLPQRLARVQRLEEEAQELLAERLEPVVTSANARGPVDSATAGAVLDDVLAQRVRRWPLVSMLHLLLNPLVRLGTALVRPAAAPVAGPATAEANSAAAAAIQGAFAQLQRLDPLAGELYRDGKLWESLAADRAASDLSRALEGVGDRQRTVLRQAMAPSRFGAILAPWRWLLTIGVLLWFPLVQPVLEAFLASNNRVVDVPLLVVKLLAVSPLLQSVSLVLIWLVALWAYLRWDTGQRVQRRLARWQKDALDPTLSPAAAVIEWSSGVLRPLAEHRKKIESLLADAEMLRRS